jgi:hypothetical protein
MRCKYYVNQKECFCDRGKVHKLKYVLSALLLTKLGRDFAVNRIVIQAVVLNMYVGRTLSIANYELKQIRERNT